MNLSQLYYFRKLAEVQHFKAINSDGFCCFIGNRIYYRSSTFSNNFTYYNIFTTI